MCALIYFLIILCLNLDFCNFEKSNSDPGDEKGTKLSDESAEWPGHLKPFGSVGKSKNIGTYKKYPKAKLFFKDYVATTIPLLMKNASTVNIAYKNFNNENFIKKWPQSRFHWFQQSPETKMSFYQFITKYETNAYVFQGEVPFFLGDHVTIPSPLLCSPVVKEFSNHMLYIGGKDQKMGIEQRDVDTIRCVYSGKQDFVLVNQSEYGDKMPDDYKDINVRSVDYVKYPDMREVEYVKATLGRGDCIYLPSKWYWQANTYNNSKSVDIMWYHKVTKVTSSQCMQKGDEPVLGDLQFAELKSWAFVQRHIALYYFASYLYLTDSYDLDKLSLALSNDDRVFRNVTSWTDEYDEITKEVLEILDINKDGSYSLVDLDAITDEVAEEIHGSLVDRIADYEDIMRDQQLELKEQQNTKKFKASEIIKPGEDPKQAVEDYINNYMLVLEDVINESMGDMVNTGTAPDFKEKMAKRQKEIDGEVPFKRRARKQPSGGVKPKSQPKVNNQPLTDEAIMAEEKVLREKVKEYLKNLADDEAEKMKKEKKKSSDSEDKDSEFTEGEAYAVVDDTVEEEILADEDEEVVTEEKKSKSSKSKKGKKKIKEEL